MNRRPAFWDTSALVPLCVDQSTSASVHVFFIRYSLVVWWAAETEVHSAMARLHRSDHLTTKEQEVSIGYLLELASSWQEILPSEEVKAEARSLLYTYPLRAADSLQLAAAMIWCRKKPQGRTFICSDARLSEAAAQAGFTVLQPQ